MSNKLQDLFSDSEEIITGTITFPNSDAAASFNKILEKVYKEGTTHTVNEVDTVELNYVDGENRYLLSPPEKLEKMTIGPTVNTIKVPVYVNGEKRELELLSINVEDGVKAYTKEGAIVEFKIFFSNDQTKNKLVFKTHPANASSFNDIVESYELASGFLDVLLVNHSEEYKESQKYFRQNILFYKRLISVQDVIKTYYSVEDVLNNKDEDYIVNKLYYLLCDKKVIRTEPSFRDVFNASVDFENGETIPEDIKIGRNLFAYYISDRELELYGKTIKIYTVNWLFNAVVSAIEKDVNKISKLHLKDNDTKPMYLSYSGFLTEEAARNEIETIMSRKDEYMNAETFSSLLEQDLELINN